MTTSVGTKRGILMKDDDIQLDKDKKPRTSARSNLTLRTRKSMATNVFLAKQVSVANRLGRHLDIKRSHQVEGELDEKNKHLELKRKKKEDCKKFCCDKEHHLCLGKTGLTWFLIFFVLIIFWAALILLLFIFLLLFIAIIGGPFDGGKMHGKIAHGSLELKTPILVDIASVKRNIDDGWPGFKQNHIAIKLPALFGNWLFFPGLSPVTLVIWNENKDKMKKSEYKDFAHKFKQYPGMVFQTQANATGVTGLTDKWKKIHESAYKDYFDKYYTKRTYKGVSCLKPAQFRPHGNDFEKQACMWPSLGDSSVEKDLKAQFCGAKKCWPVIYFTVNKVFGFIPQKEDKDEKVKVYCELDKDIPINKEFDKKDFEGHTEDKNDEDFNKDLSGVPMQFFPFLGQEDYRSPIIRYRVTKMPKEGKKDFVIKCRLNYPGYKRQMESDNNPIYFRDPTKQDSYWTRFEFSSSSACRQSQQMICIWFGLLTTLFLGPFVC